ncbi:MAG: carboxypeptidase regulatory-like domain-containing protein [Armatimonadia bacterium]
MIVLSRFPVGSPSRLFAVCALLLVLSLTQAFAVSAISGLVRNSSGTAMVGVSVALYAGESGTATATTTTNSEGRFYFHELADGRWTVKPGRTGTTFSPVYRTYTLPPSVTEANFTGTETTSAISGVIKDSTGLAISGATVSLYSGTSGTPTATTTTGTSGGYEFHGLAAGSWTVKPTRTGAVFSPVYRTYTLPPSVTEANFTGSSAGATSTISGLVKTAAGAAVSGVSVGLYQGDALKASTTTNAEGRYYFTGLGAGTYVVKPGQTGRTFDPVSRSVTAPPGTTSANFTISEATSTVSGVIKTAAGAAVSGVSVGLYQNDTLKASTTTNAEGRYYFTGLAAGTYVVTPAQTGRTFDPASRSVTAPPGTTSANFTISEATSTISGVIKTAAGAAVSGVSVGLYQGDALKASTTTNAEGRYYFTDLASGAYLVKPSQTGKVFDPVSRLVTVPPSTSIANFTIGEALSSIVGTIKMSTGAAVVGATVSLYQNDVLKRTVLTNAEGRYAFRELTAGTYVVRPSKDYLRFDPAYRSVTVAPSASGIGFTALAPEPPRLRDGAVYPTSGTPKTVFTYSVIYRDALNRAPSSAVLVIDGTQSITMTKRLEGDVNYADDCIYQAKTTLALGTHNYRFVFRVGDQALIFPGPTTAESRSGPVVKPEYFVIAGTISCGESLLEGVTVTLTTPTGATRTTTTNTNGRYVFTVSLAGEYIVTPARTGYEFDPSQKSVVVGPSTETCNFAATILN